MPVFVGIFERYFIKQTLHWRYLADASYWIYLVHLPLVVASGIWVRSFAWSWWFKLFVMLVVATSVLVATYHWFVRGTWLGVILNGRRYPLRMRTGCTDVDVS